MVFDFPLVLPWQASPMAFTSTLTRFVSFSCTGEENTSSPSQRGEMLRARFSIPALLAGSNEPYNAPSCAASLNIEYEKIAIPKSTVPSKINTITGKLTANSTRLWPRLPFFRIGFRFGTN